MKSRKIKLFLLCVLIDYCILLLVCSLFSYIIMMLLNNAIPAGFVYLLAPSTAKHLYLTIST